MESQKRKIKIVVKPGAFNSIYYPFLWNEKRVQIYFGGSSSGKSFFLAQRTVIDIMNGRNYLVLRNTAKTIRSSCWNEIVKAINAMGVRDYFDITQSTLTITCKTNKKQCLFAGLDDVEKVKSITPIDGVITNIWMEEATEMAYEDYKQLDKRLRGKSKHKKVITLSFNPVFKEHWIYKTFFGMWDESKTSFASERLSILKTTYRDNHYLEQDDIDAMENETDEYYKNVYVDGNWGVLGDVIFKNWRVEELSEMEKTHVDRLRFGLDFGFSSDPAAAVKIFVDHARRCIYVFDEIYERGLTNYALASVLKPFVGRKYIVCDSSEPKSIEELRQNAINALPARKGPDSVWHGIQRLQGYTIIVDVRCQNLRNELTLYQWKKDKDGNSLRIPQDCNNHLIDALRYATEDINFTPLGNAQVANPKRLDRVFRH